jgi:hypothetical protein
MFTLELDRLHAGMIKLAQTTGEGLSRIEDLRCLSCRGWAISLDYHHNRTVVRHDNRGRHINTAGCRCRLSESRKTFCLVEAARVSRQPSFRSTKRCNGPWSSIKARTEQCYFCGDAGGSEIRTHLVAFRQEGSLRESEQASPLLQLRRSRSRGVEDIERRVEAIKERCKIRAIREPMFPVNSSSCVRKKLRELLHFESSRRSRAMTMNCDGNMNLCQRKPNGRRSPRVAERRRYPPLSSNRTVLQISFLPAMVDRGPIKSVPISHCFHYPGGRCATWPPSKEPVSPIRTQKPLYRFTHCLCLPWSLCLDIFRIPDLGFSTNM